MQARREPRGHPQIVHYGWLSIGLTEEMVDAGNASIEVIEEASLGVGHSPIASMRSAAIDVDSVDRDIPYQVASPQSLTRMARTLGAERRKPSGVLRENVEEEEPDGLRRSATKFLP